MLNYSVKTLGFLLSKDLLIFYLTCVWAWQIYFLFCHSLYSCRKGPSGNFWLLTSYMIWFLSRISLILHVHHFNSFWTSIWFTGGNIPFFFSINPYCPYRIIVIPLENHVESLHDFLTGSNWFLLRINLILFLNLFWHHSRSFSGGQLPHLADYFVFYTHLMTKEGK